MSNECYTNYIPWKKRENEKELMKLINQLRSDEGLRIEIEDLDGNRAKFFANKTGLEYVLTIVYDKGKEENLIFSSTHEMQQKLSKLLEGKKIIDVISY